MPFSFIKNKDKSWPLECKSRVLIRSDDFTVKRYNKNINLFTKFEKVTLCDPQYPSIKKWKIGVFIILTFIEMFYQKRIINECTRKSLRMKGQIYLWYVEELTFLTTH